MGLIITLFSHLTHNNLHVTYTCFDFTSLNTSTLLRGRKHSVTQELSHYRSWTLSTQSTVLPKTELSYLPYTKRWHLTNFNSEERSLCQLRDVTNNIGLEQQVYSSLNAYLSKYHPCLYFCSPGTMGIPVTLAG